jgi:hypothetical protein
MLEPKPIYCEVAIFSCTCCGYETEVYAYYEWAETYSGRDCARCLSSKNDHFSSVVIYREDVREEHEKDLLNPYCTTLPEHLEFCDKCIAKDRIHWTELMIVCPKCHKAKDDKDTMAFKAYTQGKHREYFYKLCQEWAKPEHPWMPFLNEDGTHYFTLIGLTSGISAN